jgi:tetratricopeptide (TPR) repeat protein
LREDLLYYCAGLLLFGCALLSKTVTCTLPVALLLALWWKRGRITLREALSLAPLFALGVGMGLLTASLERTNVGATGSDWSLSFIERFLVAGRALCFYAWKLLWPVHLSFNYQRWVVDSGAWQQYLYPLAVAAVLLALWMARGRIGRGPLAAALFFAASLFPALGFFDVFPFRYSYVADHFQYLAGIGPITLVVAVAAGYVLKHHSGRLWLFTAAAVLVVSLLSVKTWSRGNLYADAWTLWNETLRSNPESSLAHNNIGSILAEQGKHQEALTHFSEALRVSPNREMPHYNMGVELAALGRNDEAMEQYEAALRIRPDFERALNNLGSLLAQKGRFEDAVRCWKKAVEIKPDYLGAHCHLLMAYSRLGDSIAARREYGLIKMLNPALAEEMRHTVRGLE